MTLIPRDTEEIYSDVRSELTSRITKLTNFVSGSFNNAFLVSYSDQVREAEIKAKAGELAGTIDYAGKDLTESDLKRLGIENVEPERINEYMFDEQLDRLAANFSVDRDPGTEATGEVTLEVSSATSIENGMEVGTEADTSGNYKKYYVVPEGTEEYDSDDTTLIELSQGENVVDVIAEDVGSEYNVGPSTITYIPNPQPSIQSVTNVNAVDGGVDEESNSSLRSRVKNAIFDSAEGGTKLGIESSIESRAEGDVEVNIDQFTDKKPPFVDVVIDGGNDSELLDLIEELRPTGIRHNLARPNKLEIDIFAEIVGTDIDIDFIETEISSELEGIGLNGSFSSSSMLNVIISSQDNIESVPALNTYISGVTNEPHVYDDTQPVYELDQGPLGRVNGEEHQYNSTQSVYTVFYDDIDETSVSVEVIIDDERVGLADTDFSVVDDNGDGVFDSIQLDGVDPDSGTVIRIDYNHNSYSIDSVEDEDGTVFEQSTDYGLIDDDGDGVVDSIDWSIGGSSPPDGKSFTIAYQSYRSFEGDNAANDRQLFDPGMTRLDT